MDAAALDADQANTVDIRVALGNLVRDPRQAALDRVGVEYCFFVRHSVRWVHKKTNRSRFCRFATCNDVQSFYSCPFATSRDRIKGNLRVVI